MERESIKSISNFDLQNLYKDIPDDSLNKNICVFGQGFIGLPLALSFSLRGCRVLGVDIDSELVHNINNGITFHSEALGGVTIQEILSRELSQDRYRAATDGALGVRSCSNIIVTVGIPVIEGECITDYLANACTVIGRYLKKEDLVVIRSTVIPGTTEEVILPLLERESGMRAGTDFYLAYSPERVAEGSVFDEFINMPTLVAGINKVSTQRAAELLGLVCETEVINIDSVKVAETSKVFENIQRDVNIAMVQEFARFTEAYGIDIFEVIKLANTHKRVSLLTPGPGVGGYCIPNAYFYLKSKAEGLNTDMELLKLARQKNAQIPEFIVNKIECLLNSVGKDLRGSKVAVLGLAMKDYSNDDRISPPVNICRLLIKRGAEVKAFDPVVATSYSFKAGSQDEALKDADVVAILARQESIVFNGFTYMAKLMDKRPICIDTKGVVNKKEAEGYGFVYWGI